MFVYEVQGSTILSDRQNRERFGPLQHPEKQMTLFRRSHSGKHQVVIDICVCVDHRCIVGIVGP